MYLNKKVSVVLLIVVALTTFITAESLLEKCLNHNNDINNNGKVTSFEKKVCDAKKSSTGISGKGKSLVEKLEKSRETSKKLKEIKKILSNS